MMIEPRALESESGFKILFECATIGILVIDRRGLIELMNPCANQLFGYTDGELVGKPIEILMPDNVKKRHVEHRDRYFGNPKTRPMGQGMELYARKKSGQIFPVEISLGNYNVGDEELAVAFVTDVTEQSKVRKIMAEREAWFRNIAENSPVMIWTSGTDKLCNYFNESWLTFTGRTLENELGNGWAEGVHPDDLKRCIAIYSEAFDARRSFEMEYRLRRNDGKFRWIVDHGKPVYMPDGTFNGYIGSCADIHERHTGHIKLEKEVQKRTKELDEALKREKELSDLKSKFVSIASHEFRTPLSALLSSASLVQQYAERGEIGKVTRHIDRIKTSVKNLNDILNDFLSLDKLEQGKIELAISGFNFQTFVTDIVEEMNNFLKQGQRIHLAYTGQTDIVQDEHILRNILINLISNASKYSQEGVIEINIAASPEQCSVHVCDHGIGIPIEQQKRIFDKFFRANNTGGIQGTGLGLNIVKKYVDVVHGSISFESKPMEGTTFSVLIPSNLQLPTDAEA